MAKWGEGDPRWIVEERPDATNVNNWHWTEKNATAWSKDKLKELLVGVEIKDASTGSVKLTEFERLEGEASANNRKAKLIFFYEWDIKIKFEGKKYGDGEKEVTGAVKVANLSDENGPDDLDISVSSDDSSVKAMVRAIGVPLVRDKLKQYMESLRAEFAKDMILPTKNNNDSANVNVNTAKTSPRLPKKEQKEAHHQMERLELGGVKFNTGEIRNSVAFVCTAPDIYRTLTERELLSAFTGGSAESDAKPGGKFSLFGGQVVGSFVQLVPDKRIRQKWRFKTWPDGHYSDVTFDVDQKEENTLVTLTQTGVPITDLERTKDGWERYYWTSIKRTFGFGSFLM